MTAVSCAEKSQGYPGAALHAPVHAHHQGHRARFSDPRRAAKIDSEEPGQTGSAPRARGGSVHWGMHFPGASAHFVPGVISDKRYILGILLAKQYRGLARPLRARARAGDRPGHTILAEYLCPTEPGSAETAPVLRGLP